MTQISAGPDGRHGANGRVTSLDRMFAAGSVAVIGASADPAKIGGKPVALMKAHFGGRIIPVNPNRDSIAGIACLPDIARIDEVPDVAVVAVPASAVEHAVGGCLRAGIRAIVLFTAGFGEIDAEGRAEQKRIADTCAEAGARLLGPNSLGFINFHSGLYATFSAALDNIWPVPGNVAIASQSGAVGTYVMALAAERGIGFSHFIATGNEADVDVADCIAWLARDPQTAVIVAYLEGSRDGTRLKSALAEAAAARKPVIAIKPGASASGLAAVRSHTGMLAGSKRVFDAALRAGGAWPAASIEEAVDIAYACSVARLPSGPETAIITPSGGAGIMLADACEDAGLTLPPIPDAAATAIRELLPLSAIGNPVDTTAQVSNDFRLYGKVIEIIAASMDVPIFLIFMAHMGKTPAVVQLLRPMLADVARHFPDRLMVLIMRASEEFRSEMTECGYLVFEDPNRAVATVAALRQLARGFARPDDPPVVVDRVEREALEAAAASAAAAADLLDRIGVPKIPIVAVATEDAAIEAAGEVGYPVALKIDSPDIAHKTEVGGVHLGIGDEAALRAAWRSMMASVRKAAPEARVAGGAVSPMIRGGIETIVGTRRDPDFGPVVMVGLGGVLAEALDDVVIAPAPVGRLQALAMVGALRAGKVFDGWRGAPPADREALANAICALAALADANADELESIEVNPFVVLPAGGAAVDVLVELGDDG